MTILRLFIEFLESILDFQIIKGITIYQILLGITICLFIFKIIKHISNDKD